MDLQKSLARLYLWVQGKLFCSSILLCVYAKAALLCYSLHLNQELCSPGSLIHHLYILVSCLFGDYQTLPSRSAKCVWNRQPGHRFGVRISDDRSAEKWLHEEQFGFDCFVHIQYCEHLHGQFDLLLLQHVLR